MLYAALARGGCVGVSVRERYLMDPEQVREFSGVVVDCRFQLQQPGAGREAYLRGHLPGARFVDLERDLSAPPDTHGGRHPLPTPAAFARRLAAVGVDRDTPTLLYDDSRGVFAARLWWMLRALAYATPRILDGGYAAWCALGDAPESGDAEPSAVATPAVASRWERCCDREQLRELQAHGAVLVDAREARRYRGEYEPIDPVAGHIPGAHNRPWQDFTTDDGRFHAAAGQRDRWGDLLDADTLVLYCGSGVSACVGLLSLALAGREGDWLYAGSWSDWCSYL
jgi:thiosulfate/3-mercaptopyruvate sulfurtransferase